MFSFLILSNLLNIGKNCCELRSEKREVLLVSFSDFAHFVFAIILCVLKRKKLKELFSDDLHIANWGRRYAERELLATEERLISMLSAIASERYKELLEKEPDLLQRLPLGSIATYLGITQASLSRIRAKITRP